MVTFPTKTILLWKKGHLHLYILITHLFFRALAFVFCECSRSSCKYSEFGTYILLWRSYRHISFPCSPGKDSNMPDPNFNWHRTLICQLFIILFKKNLRRLVFRDSMVFKTFHSQDINFWGNVYPTFVALPYLHQSNGRIIINASVESWLPMPRMSLYAVSIYVLTFCVHDDNNIVQKFEISGSFCSIISINILSSL